VEFIQNYQVLDLVFGESTHTELIKRSFLILKFLSNFGCLTPGHIDKLFQLTVGRHEAIRHDAFELLGQLIGVLNFENLLYALTKLSRIEAKDLDQQVLKVIREFGSNPLCRLEPQQAEIAPEPDLDPMLKDKSEREDQGE